MKPTPKLSPAATEILGALTEFRDGVRSGEPIEKIFTVRTVELDLRPREYGAGDVKRIRKQLKLSQDLFARFLGVDVNTLRSWEHGRKKPSPIACRFMDEIGHSPDHWSERLREVIVAKRGDVVTS